MFNPFGAPMPGDPGPMVAVLSCQARLRDNKPMVEGSQV